MIKQLEGPDRGSASGSIRAAITIDQAHDSDTDSSSVAADPGGVEAIDLEKLHMMRVKHNCQLIQRILPPVTLGRGAGRVL